MHSIIRIVAPVLILAAGPATALATQASKTLDPSTGEYVTVEFSSKSEATGTHARTGEKAFGTDDRTIHSLNALTAFIGYSPTDDGNMSGFGAERYCTSSCNLFANVALPTGVRVVEMEVEYEDNNASNVTVVFNRCGFLQDTCSGIATWGSTGTPGVDIDETTFDYTVDNFNNSYLVGLLFGAGGSSLNVRNVRLYYQRQVSPAPGSATFSDVPTSHPFFQHVEALSDSGITAGCGGGEFCPDDALTRGQMAVFLAKALGLHWQN